MSSSASGAPNPAERRHERRSWPLLVILAISAAPVIAAWLAYFVWPPQSRVNYGELVEPRPVSDPELSAAGGGAFRLSQLRGKWVMLQIAPGACGEACRSQLLYMRQVRLTQGREMDRVERVWLVSDETPVEPALVREYEGTHVLRAAGSKLLREFPDAEAGERIYLIDPLGNLMLRFPRNADPQGMRKDLSRLLRVSRIG